MPSQTGKGYPYPVGTDKVADGDNAIQALATAVDTKAGVRCSGEATVPITAVNTPVSLTITFPAGLFTAAPASVVVGLRIANPLQAAVASGSITATSFVLWGARSTGSATFQAEWTAHQN